MRFMIPVATAMLLCLMLISFMRSDPVDPEINFGTRSSYWNTQDGITASFIEQSLVPTALCICYNTLIDNRRIA